MKKNPQGFRTGKGLLRFVSANKNYGVDIARERIAFTNPPSEVTDFRVANGTILGHTDGDPPESWGWELVIEDIPAVTGVKPTYATMWTKLERPVKWVRR